MGARLAAMALIAPLLAACGGFFGTPEAPPLPGERVPILLAEQGLSADPKIADISVRIPPPVENRDWPQAGGFPDHAMHHLATAEVPKLAWTADIGAASDDDTRILSAPIVVRDVVYTMDAEATVTAFSAADGSEIWRVELTDEDDDEGILSGGIAYDAGRIIASTGFAQVIALDARDGTELWRQSVSGPMRGAPAAAAGQVFVVTIDNQLHALDAQDGTKNWTHSGIVEAAGLLGGATPAVAGDIVIAPYSSGEIYALRIENGRVLWSDTLSPIRGIDPVTTLAHVRGHPVIDRGFVYAISNGSRMVAIDMRTGGRAWDQQIGGINMPWIAGEFVFVVTSDQQVVAISRRGGRIRWVTQLRRFVDEEEREDPITWYGPVLASDRLLLAGSSGLAIAVSPYTGEVIGQIELPDAVHLPPVIAGKTVYFLTDGADLVAYR